MQCSSAVCLIDRKGLSPSTPPPCATFTPTRTAILFFYHRPISVRTPLSSSTARSCSFPVLMLTVCEPCRWKSQWRHQRHANQSRKSFTCCHSYQDTRERNRLICHVPRSHFGWRLGTRLFSVANRTAESSTVERCIASKAQSLCHACTPDRMGQIERAEWEAKGCG